MVFTCKVHFFALGKNKHCQFDKSWNVTRYIVYRISSKKTLPRIISAIQKNIYIYIHSRKVMSVLCDLLIKSHEKVWYLSAGLFKGNTVSISHPDKKIWRKLVCLSYSFDYRYQPVFDIFHK